MNDCSTIFVDCFDTIIHRREHPFQVLQRWARMLSRLYPQLNADIIYQTRFTIIRSATEKIDTHGIYFVYKQMADTFLQQGFLSNEEHATFCDDARTLEITCESSVHYVNKSLVSFLRKQSAPIYCVTDFHFSSKDMEQILENAGIRDLFAGVFSSASHGKTKHHGDLYNAVLTSLHIPADHCTMIGDNRYADILQAKKHGIKCIYRPHIFHQNRLKIARKLHINSRENEWSFSNRIWKQSDDYSEYVAVFFTFTRRLYRQLRENGYHRVVFLAREGYYLRQLFECYQSLCIPASERIDTSYLKCSRRAIHSVQWDKCQPEFFGDISIRNYFRSIGFNNTEIDRLPFDDVDTIIPNFSASSAAEQIRTDPTLRRLIETRFSENQNAFKFYVSSFIENDRMAVVDVGWSGSMQQGISALFPNYHITGYYVGIYGNLLTPPTEIPRNGLIFNKSQNGQTTKYYDILRSNTQLYEQLLAAPHGSTCFYRMQKDRIFIEEEWDSSEETLYRDVISALQKKMLHQFQCLCCLASETQNESVETKHLAELFLKSCLLQSNQRLQIMKRLNQGFIFNFQQETVGLTFQHSAIRISPKDILIHPERYVRYFSKLGIVLDAKKLAIFRKPINVFFYLYVRIINRL